MQYFSQPYHPTHSARLMIPSTNLIAWVSPVQGQVTTALQTKLISLGILACKVK